MLVKLNSLQAGKQRNSGDGCYDNSDDCKCGIQKTVPVRLDIFHSHHPEEDSKESRQEHKDKPLGESPASRDEQDTYETKNKGADGHRSGLDRHSGIRLF